MRAVGISAPGGPEAVQLIDRDVREPRAGEVRIAVAAAAVNPTDMSLRTRGVEGVAPPWTPGMDAAGTIESVGPGVDRLAVGEQVMAAVLPRRPEGGAQAELIVVPAAAVVPVPAGIPLEQAAILPMNGLTALRGLEQLGLAPGQTLAVTGATGLLGSLVIAIASEQGLHVIADAKPEDEELVRGFGAELVVPRGDRFVEAVRAAHPEGVDGLYDTALLHDAVFGAIRDGGGMVVVRGWAPAETERGIVVHQVMVFEQLERTDWLELLRELAASGRIKLREVDAYPPERAGEAEDLLEAGGLRRRPVIVF